MEIVSTLKSLMDSLGQTVFVYNDTYMWEHFTTATVCGVI